MKKSVLYFLNITLVFNMLLCMSLQAQDLGISTNKKILLKYVSPIDLFTSDIIKSDKVGSQKILTDFGEVTAKINSSTNEILLFGNENSIENAAKMVEFIDVAPRQIVIEVKIIEIDNQKIKETGINWQTILNNTSVPFRYDYTKDNSKSNIFQIDRTSQFNSQSDYNNVNRETWSGSDRDLSTIANNNKYMNSTDFGINSNMKIGDFLKVLENSDGAKVLNTPKIVTINNKKGTILDGSRMIYVDKYASYSNLFETQELKTGLFLSVTPSLGASGYIKMDVEAKLTNLSTNGYDSRPIEIGQMLENTVVVKEGESIILGGLKRSTVEKIDNSVPILGSILPFLFSSEKSIDITKDVLLVLTPTVIDLQKMEIPELEKSVK